MSFETLLKQQVVSIFVDDERCGTGFFVADDLVATCAHVIDESASTAPTRPLIKARLTSGDEVVAGIDQWRSANQQDIAFLRCRFAEDVDRSVARLKEIEPTARPECDAFGFPKVADIEGIYAKVKVMGIVHTQSNEPLIQLDSKELTRGFSGAPVVERETGRTIGMVLSIVNDQVGNLAGRLRDNAFAIPIMTLANLSEELIVEPFTVEQEHQQALSRLMDRAVSILKKSERATNRLADKTARLLDIHDAENCKDELRAETVTKILFSQPMDQVLDVVLEAYHEASQHPDELDSFELETFVSFANHVFPAVYDEDQIRIIRTAIDHQQPFLTLPSTSTTIVEVLMAGVDGRRAIFSSPVPGNLPNGIYQIPQPPELGITDDQFESQFEEGLFEVLGIPHEFRQVDKINLATAVKLRTKNIRLFYIFAMADEPTVDARQEHVITKLKAKYPDVVFLKQCPNEDDMNEFSLLFRMQEMFEK